VNLLRNALYEVSTSGHIRVSSSVSSLALPHDATAETATAATVLIRVEDDGPGIAESVLPHLFEAFVSSRLDAKGTGLGLTVAAGIIQQHGGSIRAYNRLQGGACIEVELPAVVASSNIATRS
ncbi:MAG: ATP-binding protein, partial [Bryobacterales bacterium]|nr:ATP-binding protein [Bryobacterales bacterium]